MAQVIREFESHRLRQKIGFSDTGVARALKPESGGFGERNSPPPPPLILGAAPSCKVSFSVTTFLRAGFSTPRRRDERPRREMGHSHQRRGVAFVLGGLHLSTLPIVRKENLAAFGCFHTRDWILAYRQRIDDGKLSHHNLDAPAVQ
jgi:hypothetical protein